MSMTTSPEQRLTQPERFGKRPDVDTLTATTEVEEVLNEVALWQHTSALEVFDKLVSAGLSLNDLASHLSTGKDQLRRKFNGVAVASIADVTSWNVGTKTLLGITPQPKIAVTPKINLPLSPEHLSSWERKVWQGDCIPLMKAMPSASINLILADLPYGTTRNAWDSLIPLDELWECYEHVLKPGGCVVLTSAQPFTAALIMSKIKWFKYEWIWSKTIGSGQLNAKKQPLRTHESVLVFAPKAPPYFPQMEVGTPYKMNRKTGGWTGRGYNTQTDHKVVNTGTRYPKSVLNVPNPRIKGGHPTQKPLALFEYLIKTYTEPGGIVLDNVMGSGTTAEAAENTGRRWVGMELDKTFAAQANMRIPTKGPIT